jgi:hypothetical protein
MTSRKARHVPWYYSPAPQCDTVVGRIKEQCLFTASYEDAKTHSIFLCGVHAKMVKFRVVPIAEQTITIR